jgi:hypothetical protein
MLFHACVEEGCSASLCIAQSSCDVIIARVYCKCKQAVNSSTTVLPRDPTTLFIQLKLFTNLLNKKFTGNIIWKQFFFLKC